MATEQALFPESLQRALPEARAAYLDGACGTDTALPRRVEAEAAARLQHPNIMRTQETGERDGQPCYSLGGIGSLPEYETSSPH